jgi:hypothetical protein
MNCKPILYDLGVAFGAVGLWLTPFDASRLLGYSVSLVFAGDAYYRGVSLLSKEKQSDEKQAIAYEAETEFYDQLLGSNIEAELEVRALEVENRMLQRMIPLMARKTQLEHQLHQVAPVHPELTDDEKEESARYAIAKVFDGQPSQSSDEEIRKHFPESMDATSWKAILKALQSGATKAEIIKDVLGCSQATEQIGKAYFALLKEKFLE